MGIRSKLILAVCTFPMLAALASFSVAQDAPQAKARSANAENPLRIGFYDSRAIAIAYAPSKYNPVSEKMKEFETAKAKGDKELMQQLEEWGKKHQRELHRQGFSIVPVTNLLEHVKDRLPEVASKAKVIAISRHCDFALEQVELVDVTDQLVALFDPSEKTLKTIAQIRKVSPVDLDQLRGHDD